MSDEGLHEVHLNGKQLVFAFMTVTVVAVVIFLCGVMVGRGVRGPSSAAVDLEASGGDPTVDAQGAPPAASPSTGAPLSSGELLSYSDRLTSEAPVPINETLRDASPATAPAAALPVPVSPARADVAPPSRPAAPARSTEPPGRGFVVQVAAVGKRAEAETISQRLSGKGYPAYVTSPGASGPSVFRVRVGKYDSRREAESVANRLEKEEQFKPWITR